MHRSPAASPDGVAYLSDVEGRWDKLESFVARCPHVSLVDGALELRDGVTLVFGGDAIDRGPHARRIVRTLLAAQRAYGERVVLLAGNRDLNKLRLWRELRGAPPARAASAGLDGSRGALLRWILRQTMGAPDAFEHRAAELRAEGHTATDEEVVESFLADVAPGGELRAYLEACRLGVRNDETLFVHGGVTLENLGAIPGRAERARDVDTWLAELDVFYREELDAFARDRAPDALMAYQAPRPGTRAHQESVVYARLSDELANPNLPPPATVARLRASGVERLVVGHTPSGDCPAVVREDGFELVMADNSYGRLEEGSSIFLTRDRTEVVASTELDDGRRLDVVFTSDRTELDSPLGRRVRDTGALVKARLASGDYLLFRGLGPREVTQTSIAPADLLARALVTPRD